METNSSTLLISGYSATGQSDIIVGMMVRVTGTLDASTQTLTATSVGIPPPMNGGVSFCHASSPVAGGADRPLTHRRYGHVKTAPGSLELGAVGAMRAK